jgi:hypothetical protein
VQQTPVTPALTGSRRLFPLLRLGMLLRGMSKQSRSLLIMVGNEGARHAFDKIFGIGDTEKKIENGNSG